VVLEAVCVDEELLVAAETGAAGEDDWVLELGVLLTDAADKMVVEALCVDEDLAVADGVKMTDEVDAVLELAAPADTLTEEDVDLLVPAEELALD
ncbi:hypothetical protein LTR28_003244, partial [Elasticomyces elasticus]